jgi:Flp pilus assembly pilin Flp
MFRARKTPGVEGGASDDIGAAMIEYVMILGFITALVIFIFRLLYPSAGQDIESLVNAWGDKLATQIAGDKMEKSSDAWGVN